MTSSITFDWKEENISLTLLFQQLSSKISRFFENESDKVVTVKIQFESFTDKLKKLTFTFDKSNLFQTYKDNLLECPLCFRCEFNAHGQK